VEERGGGSRLMEEQGRHHALRTREAAQSAGSRIGATREMCRGGSTDEEI
jgi:hypothetical protein